MFHIRTAFVAPLVLALMLSCGAAPVLAAGPLEVLAEDFDDLQSWKPLSFDKIDRQSTYSVGRFDGRQVLIASSNSSASGIVHSQPFNVFEYPIVSWTWRVDSVYDKGDASSKAGDDYPLRLYVLFEYDPDQAGLGEKITFGVLKTIYGEYPPQSSLNYIWANKVHDTEVIPNPFTDRARMIPVQSGKARLGQWISESRNMVEDYRKAFGEDPPDTARLAVMNDSDNTGESSTSYLDCLRVSQDNQTSGGQGSKNGSSAQP
jgi:hypothetical protein